MNPSPLTDQRLATLAGRPGALRIPLAALATTMFAAGWLVMLATGAPMARADDAQSVAIASKAIQLLRADDFGVFRSKARDGAFASESLDVFDSKLATATGL